MNDTPAFPLQTKNYAGDGIFEYSYVTGMTERTYIATRMMQSLVSCYVNPADAVGNAIPLAEDAAKLTDALIERLNGTADTLRTP